TQAFHRRRARYLAQAGDAEGARHASEQAQAVQPSTTIDFFLGGLDAYSAGGMASARELCERALPLQPKHYWSHYGLALCRLREQRWDTAVAHLTACLAL